MHSEVKMLEKKEIGKWKGMDALRAEMVAICHGRWLVGKYHGFCQIFCQMF